MQEMRKHRGTFMMIMFVLASNACTDELPDRKARPEAAQQLLKLRGYEFDEKSFHAAARASDLMAITAFIDGGINVNSQSDADGRTTSSKARRGQFDCNVRFGPPWWCGCSLLGRASGSKICRSISRVRATAPS